MTYDIVVVGLGVYGCAVAAEAGSRGYSVLALDRYEPAHATASSHGSSRIFRHTTVESPDYLGPASRAHEMWSKLDAESGGSLTSRTGFALVTARSSTGKVHHGVDDLTRRAADIASRHEIEHEHLRASDFMTRYPDLHLDPSAEVFFEPGAYLIRPDVAIAAFVDRAKRSSVTVETGVGARHAVRDGGFVRLEVDGAMVRCRQLVLTTGPWRHWDLLGHEPVEARIVPQVGLQTASAAARASLDFPAFAYVPEDGDLVFGAPAIDGSVGAKIGIEQDAREVESPESFPDQDEFVECTARAIRAAASQILPGFDVSVSTPDLCFYTSTPGSRHVVRRHDDDQAIVLVSACSGHGFKYAPAVAEKIVDDVAAHLW